MPSIHFQSDLHPLGKSMQNFLVGKIFRKYNLFIGVKALPSFSLSFMSHPGTLQWGMWLEEVLWGHKRQVLKGCGSLSLHTHNSGQVMRSDPKLIPTWPFVGKCLSGGWGAFQGRIPHTLHPNEASVFSVSLSSLPVINIFLFFTLLFETQREQVRRKGRF